MANRYFNQPQGNLAMEAQLQLQESQKANQPTFGDKALMVAASALNAGLAYKQGRDQLQAKRQLADQEQFQQRTEYKFKNDIPLNEQEQQLLGFSPENYAKTMEMKSLQNKQSVQFLTGESGEFYAGNRATGEVKPVEYKGKQIKARPPVSATPEYQRLQEKRIDAQIKLAQDRLAKSEEKGVATTEAQIRKEAIATLKSDKTLFDALGKLRVSPAEYQNRIKQAISLIKGENKYKSQFNGGGINTDKD